MHFNCSCRIVLTALRERLAKMGGEGLEYADFNKVG